MSTRFEIPKIRKTLRLSDYAQEFGDVAIEVWVNPSVGLLNEYKAIIEADTEITAKLQSVTAWIAQIWQDWTAEDINTLITASSDTDPGLWAWLVNNTFRLIADHRTQAKKN